MTEQWNLSQTPITQVQAVQITPPSKPRELFWYYEPEMLAQMHALLADETAMGALRSLMERHGVIPLRAMLDEMRPQF
jgi:hypothetical protein